MAFKSRSSVFNVLLSSLEMLLGGMRATLATTSSISLLPMVFLRFGLGRMRCAAPASSITSMALSGKKRSLIYLADSSTAVVSALALYLTL